MPFMKVFKNNVELVADSIPRCNRGHMMKREKWFCSLDGISLFLFLETVIFGCETAAVASAKAVGKGT